MMPKMQVDTGAIKFVLRGANVMAPGLTSAGGVVEQGVEIGAPVQITAEGCTHACAIGIMTMTSAQLAEKPTGQAIEAVHSLGDNLWKLEKVFKE
jgi:PUA domain protein